jgi:endoglucanase
MKTTMPLIALLIAVAAFSGFEYRKMKAEYETNLAVTITRAETAEYRTKFAGPTGIGDGIAKHGWLSVVGTQLTDEHGEAVQLRGMSSHGLTWYPEYVNAGALEFTKEQGANLFRAAMYSDDYSGGYLHSDIERKFNASVMYIAIENALAADMYVIADWHLLMDENPLQQTDAAVEFFSELSKRYAAEPGIIYEICNEPNGDTAWADIKKYADKVIPAIRKNAPNAVIIIGTPQYSYKVLDVTNNRLSYDNIMYAYHYYSSLGVDFYATLDTAESIGLPVFVSEWGISESTSGALLTENAHQFADYLNAKEISWAAWSLSNKDEPYSVLRPETSKLNDWTDDELSATGKLIFSKMGVAKHAS